MARNYPNYSRRLQGPRTPGEGRAGRWSASVPGFPSRRQDTTRKRRRDPPQGEGGDEPTQPAADITENRRWERRKRRHGHPQVTLRDADQGGPVTPGLPVSDNSTGPLLFRKQPRSQAVDAKHKKSDRDPPGRKMTGVARQSRDNKQGSSTEQGSSA